MVSKKQVRLHYWPLGSHPRSFQLRSNGPMSSTLSRFFRVNLNCDSAWQPKQQVGTVLLNCYWLQLCRADKRRRNGHLVGKGVTEECFHVICDMARDFFKQKHTFTTVHPQFLLPPGLSGYDFLEQHSKSKLAQVCYGN